MSKQVIKIGKNDEYVLDMLPEQEETVHAKQIIPAVKAPKVKKTSKAIVKVTTGKRGRPANPDSVSAIKKAEYLARVASGIVMKRGRKPMGAKTPTTVSIKADKSNSIVVNGAVYITMLKAAKTPSDHLDYNQTIQHPKLGKLVRVV